MNKKIVIILIIVLLSAVPCFTQKAYADDLSDNIDYQLEKLDLSDLQNYLNELDCLPQNTDFSDILLKMLNGEFDVNYDSVFSYVFDVFFGKISSYIPVLFTVICLYILTFFITQRKNNGMLNEHNDFIKKTVLLISMLIIGKSVIDFYSETVKTLNKINSLVEIISPIIFSLMISSENLSSVSIFRISNGFLTMIISDIIIKIMLPLILVSLILRLLTFLSDVLQLNKLSDALENFVKKSLLAVFFIFGLFITVKGLGAKTFDNISIKATKYALSNSVPIIGNFVKDSFDIITAGSILIKNSLGISCVIILFYIIIVPIIKMFSFNFLLRISNGIIGCFDNCVYNDVTLSTAKFIDYLCAFIFIVGFSFFIVLMLIILCTGGI